MQCGIRLRIAKILYGIFILQLYKLFILSRLQGVANVLMLIMLPNSIKLMYLIDYFDLVKHFRNDVCINNRMIA